MEGEQNIISDTLEGPRLKPGIPAITIEAESDERDFGDALWADYDFGDDPEKGIISGGPESYVISPVTSENLFSDKYLNCLGTIGIGRDAITGKEIAFISHQDPEFFLNRGPEQTKKFETDFKNIINDLVAQSQEGTIEIVLFGGNDTPDDPSSKKSVDYTKSIELLKTFVQEVAGFKPKVLQGPNRRGGAIDATVFTAERKIIFGNVE